MNARRLFLTRMTKFLMLIGMAFVIYPFFATFLPEKSVDAQRQQQWQRVIDLHDLKIGELRFIHDWPGGPVAIYRRSAHEIEGLLRIANQLYDPQSQNSKQPDTLRNSTRSHLAEYFVFVPVDTERSCQIRALPANKQPQPDIDWYGGFSEPCIGSLYDTAGRIYQQSRGERQYNLAVPEYRALDKTRIQLTRTPN